MSRRADLAATLAACALLPLGLGSASTQAAAPMPMAAPTPLNAQLVQLIDTEEVDGHTNVTIEFSCTVRYITNLPLNHGTSTTITLRLGPDCGALLTSLAPQLPLVGGDTQVSGARVDSVVPGEATLELTWARDFDFVMAPTSNGRGLRVRLFTGSRTRKSSGYVTELEAPEGYAVNLDSSDEAFAPAAVEAAAKTLATQAYVSETDIEERHWYRLRVGPFTTRQEAERVLKIAVSTYPRAWLAINDDSSEIEAVQRAGVVAPAAAIPTDPPLPEETRAALLQQAHTAMDKHQYPEAIELLTRLQRQSEFPGRAEAQELIGLARERAGQLAHAKAEYEEYLRRYPNGAAAERVRARLQALVAAALAPKATGDFSGGAQADHWKMAGSAALTYQYGQDQVSSAGTTTTTNSLDAFLFYGDFLMRNRGERFDFTARIDAGYTANLVSTPGGSQDRTTLAYVELSDRHTGLTERLGRQTLASEGVVGLFDGLFVGYQYSPKLSFSVAGGFPAYTSYSQFSSSDKFGTVSVEYGPYKGAWIFDGYLYDEQNGGSTERRAVGMQTRYSEPGRSAVVLADYDIFFQQLNALTLIGNLKMGSHWVVGFDADHRRSPLLLLSNALIGQSATDLSALDQLFTPSQIKQLALDRTATSSTFVLSATRPLSERWQLLADVSGLELSGTPASGGVSATTSTGLDKNASLQFSGSSLIQASDLHFFGIRYDNSPTARSLTLSWNARFVLPGAWRLGPRLSVEELNDPTLGGIQYLYLPELRGDWTGKKSVFEVDGGYQLQQQQAIGGATPVPGQNERHLYGQATYRLRF